MVHLQVKNTLGSNFLSLALWGWVAHLSLGAIVLKMHALKVVWCHIMLKLKLSSLGKQKLERNCKTNGSCSRCICTNVSTQTPKCSCFWVKSLALKNKSVVVVQALPSYCQGFTFFERHTLKKSWSFEISKILFSKKWFLEYKTKLRLIKGCAPKSCCHLENYISQIWSRLFSISTSSEIFKDLLCNVQQPEQGSCCCMHVNKGKSAKTVIKWMKSECIIDKVLRLR